VDILETADELTVFVDMPGVKNDGVDVNLGNGQLTIQGRVEARRPEGLTPLLTEYGVGDYHRVFQVSEKIDSAGITAELTNGVLTLHLPKGEAIKPRRIALVAK
jgi:HSP20 family molecular chaperone IbpA